MGSHDGSELKEKITFKNIYDIKKNKLSEAAQIHKCRRNITQIKYVEPLDGEISLIQIKTAEAEILDKDYQAKDR